MAILTFFAAGGNKKENRAKAALLAAGVGTATYATTHHTDWGRENLGALDGVELSASAGGTVVKTSPTDGGSTIGKAAGNSSTSGSNGFWSSVSGWLTSPAGQLATGTAAGKAVGIPNWLLYGGLAAGAYLLLKKD